MVEVVSPHDYKIETKSGHKISRANMLKRYICRRKPQLGGLLTEVVGSSVYSPNVVAEALGEEMSAMSVNGDSAPDGSTKNLVKPKLTIDQMNMLKGYIFCRKPQLGGLLSEVVGSSVYSPNIIAEALGEEMSDMSVNGDSAPDGSTKTLVNPKLPIDQMNELAALLEEYADVFSDKPGSTKGPGRRRNIHRNLLLPPGQLPHNTQPSTPVQPENDLQHSSEHDELEVDPPLSFSSEYEGNSSSDDLPVVESDSGRSRNKYVTTTSSASEGHPTRRSTRQRRRPQEMRDGHYIHQHTISKTNLPLQEWEWKSNFLRVIKPFFTDTNNTRGSLRYYGWLIHPHIIIIICTSFISSIDYNVFIILQCHLRDHFCRKVT